MTQNVQSAQTPEKSGAVNELVEIFKTIFYALLIALVLRVVFFQPFTIPSASMEPNLYEGDYIIVSKFSYGYSHHSIPFSPPLFKGRILEQQAKRGDIAVCKLPTDNRTDRPRNGRALAPLVERGSPSVSPWLLDRLSAATWTLKSPTFKIAPRSTLL